MNYASKVKDAIEAGGFFIEKTAYMPHGERLYLGVGVVVCIYDNGTVMVQGKAKPKYVKSLWHLSKTLPPGTRWHHAKGGSK